MSDCRHALFQALLDAERVLLTGPVEADGDSLGACLALQRVLRRHGVLVDVAGTPAFRYRWMPEIDELLADDRVFAQYDAVVVLDGDRHRMAPRVTAAFAAARVCGIIDHHASTRTDGYTHPWVDPAATSTTEMLYGFFLERGEAIDHDVAALLYAGAIFDTGAFRYSNTTPATHHMAADLMRHRIDHSGICTRVLMERTPGGLRCAGHIFSETRFHFDGQVAVSRISLADRERFGILPGDLEGVVDALVHVHGVEVAALLIQRQPDLTKASLRSRGQVNVGAVAQKLSSAGGGHAKAAGASLAGSFASAEDRVVGMLVAAVQAHVEGSPRQTHGTGIAGLQAPLGQAGRG